MMALTGDPYFWLVVALLLIMLAPAALRYWSWQQARQASYHRAWDRLSLELGMAFEPGPYFTSARVTGHYRERQLSLTLAPEAGVRTCILLCLRRPLPGKVVIAERGLLAQAWRRLRHGNQGPDPSFTRRFEVRATMPGAGERLAGSGAVRRKLLQTRAVTVIARDERLELLHPGIVTSSENLTFLFDLLSDVARLLEAVALELPAQVNV